MYGFIRKKGLSIIELEKRLMFDASLTGIITSTVIGEDASNAAPTVIDNDVTISGTTLDFNGESLTVGSTGLAEDDLNIIDEGTGAGQIGFNGSIITYEGTQIGTLASDGQDGADLVVNFDNATSQAALERLIENITYQNTSDDPATTKNLSFSVGALFSENVTITIVPQNEAPNVTNNGMTLDEGGTETLTAAMLGITDPDNTNSELVINVSANTLSGQVELTTDPGVAINSFTFDDVVNNRVIYTHSGSEVTSDSFDFEVTDGTDTLATDTFDITITPVNDPLTIENNVDSEVFSGYTITIGAEEGPGQFGTEVYRASPFTGFGQLGGSIDNQSSQFSLIFTTAGAPSTSVPGQVLFESGGSGVGVGLYLDNNNQLAFYAGGARNIPRVLGPDVLATSTQYAVVVEIDIVTQEIRMHYEQANDFDWFNVERTPDAKLINYTATDQTGGNSAGYGELGGGSYGGYTGGTSGPSTFQGSLDSDFVITRLPTGPSYINNTLTVDDIDTLDGNIVYTITADAVEGELYLDGVLLGVSDTFTQDDLDTAKVTYVHSGSLAISDSFDFSVTDGTTTLNSTHTINVETVNTAPVITPGQTFEAPETTTNGTALGYLEATDAEENLGQTLTYSITGGTGAGIFTIDSSNGEITVLDNSTIDYETTTSYTLDIEVVDDAGSPLSDTDTITINILDVNEAPIVSAGGPFNIDENSTNNTFVGQVVATDNLGENLSYSIVSGNTNSAFKINAAGQILVRDTNEIDYEAQSSYTLRVRVTDDHADSKYTERNFTVNLNDLAEAPTFDIVEVIKTIDSNAKYSADTGNWYRYYNSNVGFTTALSNAAAATLNGVNGHLLTITSVEENTFIDNNVMGNHIWLAASDMDNEGAWVWVAGPEAGTQFSQGGTAVNGLYERWAGSEPNTPSYDYAYMNTNGNWYDDANGNNRRYVVEWEGVDVINNDSYVVPHDNPDGSDILNGDSIGYVQAADADAGNTVIYSIEAGNDDGIFEVDANTGEIRILDNSNLDTSVLDNYTLTIRATEVGGTGLFDEIDIDITFNENFSITANNGLTADESAITPITTAELNISDSDTPATDITIKITTAPSEGFLAYAASPGAAISSFTLDDLQNDLIVYNNNGGETISDSFIFEVTDGSGSISGQTFNITINPVNDAPTITVNTGATVIEGGSRTITAAMLDMVDADDADTDVTYTASNYLNGAIEVNGLVQNTFTQDDINNNRVAFIHDGAEGNGRFDISLADGGEDSVSPDTATFTLTKTDVNDAPLFTTNNGTDVVEGATVTITTADLNVTDPDDSGTGITYTLSGIINGQVELSTNPNVPIVTFTQADLSAGRVVFRHDGNESDAEFTATVQDGGEDSAGTDTITFNLNKIDVNDSPTIGNNLGSSVNQNSIVVLKNSVLSASDPDDSGAGLTFTITSTTNGQLEYLSNPNVAITSFTQADINNSLVVFRHSGPLAGTEFDFTIADGGEDSATTASGTFVLSVDNTNDAPIIATNSPPTIDEGATIVIDTTMLDSFDPDDFGAGLTWTASNLSNGYIQVNGSTQNTFTQADLDAGLVTFTHDDTETLLAGFDIQVADGGEDSASPDTGTFTMAVNLINEAPSITVNTGVTMNEGASQTITSAMLDMADVDDADTDVTYTVSNLSNGVIEVSGSVQATFTQDDINNNRVVFIHDGSETTSAGFDISLADGGEDSVSPDTDSFAITVTPVNEAPSITVNTGVTMDEGASQTITSAMLDMADVDDADTDVTYTVSNLSNGVIEVNGSVQATFTQDDINNNRVVFIHDGSETTSAGFDISLADGGEDSVSPDTDSFAITVTPVNEAPSITVNTGVTMDEGASQTITSAMLDMADVDDADTDVTYTVSNLSNGVIEVNGSVQATFTQDDINNNRVVFIHDGSETTSAGFDISLADGGEDSVSPDTDSFAITVTPVNDSPNIVISNGNALAVDFNDYTINGYWGGQDSGTYTVSPDGSTLVVNGNGWKKIDLAYTVNANTILSFDFRADIEGEVQGLGFDTDNDGNSQAAFQFLGTQLSYAATNKTFNSYNAGDGWIHYEIPVGNFYTGAFNYMTFFADHDAGGTNDSQFRNLVLYENTNEVRIDEGGTTILSNTNLNVLDDDDGAADLTFTASNYLNGHIEVGGTVQNTFTQADIDSGLVAFIHDGSESNGAGFDVSVIDGGEDSSVASTGRFDLVVDPINDAPSITVNTGTSVTEGSTATITNTMLNMSDTDDKADEVTYTASNINGGHIEVNSVLQSTFTQADIDGGLVVFVHDGGETDGTFDVEIADGGEDSAGTDTAAFTLSRINVNDAPTNVMMSVNSFSELTNIGDTIGYLSTADVDVPSDSFTYTIMADPDSMFSISGNQLRLAAEADFETAISHSVTIRTDDGNGGTFDRIFTLSVDDESELTLNTFPNDPTPNSGDGYLGIKIEEEGRRDIGDSTLIHNLLSSDPATQMSAFYTEYDFMQILRQNTTFEIQGLLAQNDNTISFDPSLTDALLPEDNFGTANSNEELQENDLQRGEDSNVERLRAILEQLNDYDNDQIGGTDQDSDSLKISRKESPDLYDIFEETMYYHELRQQRLKEALMAES